MIFLGIETSCDETAMALLNEKKEILAHIVFSQINIHKEFGGVIPEVAARNHLMIIDKVFNLLLEKANITIKDIDVIGSTIGPGLIGGILVGTIFAKSLASILEKQFIAVNHLEGHALICQLTNNIEFPFILFLLSGGHCQILEVNGIGKYKKIGDTIDDALGECFDKVGKMLNLEYPAGPKIEELAKNGNESAFKFPTPLINIKGKRNKDKFNFSFSGLKTAVKIQIEKIFELTDKTKCDICASFQRTIIEILNNRLINVLETNENKNIKNVVISGGVSANQYIKENMKKICEKYNYNIITPPIQLCTDNGIMIANVVIEKFKLNQISDLDCSPLSRWKLEDL